MFNQIIDCVSERTQIILNDIENNIRIDVEITVRDVVTHSFHIVPRNFRSQF